MAKIKFAPREVFRKILEWAVIPTFDLLLNYENKGFILVKRKIDPYKNKWALPGLRIFKGESIEDVIRRIAKNELGLSINPKKRFFLGQYVGKFKTEHNRQDLSTGFMIEVRGRVRLNGDHFSDYKIVKKLVPNMGAIYKFYLKEGLKLKKFK